MEFPEKQLNKCCNFSHKQIQVLGKNNKPLSSVSASLRRFSKYCKKEDREKRRKEAETEDKGLI